jgi:hypothetical protein
MLSDLIACTYVKYSSMCSGHFPNIGAHYSACEIQFTSLLALAYSASSWLILSQIQERVLGQPVVAYMLHRTPFISRARA